MKVLLREDVDNLGYAGEVHTVANGFGRNFLLPKGLAVKATPDVMKQAEAWRKRAEARRAELRAEHDLLSEKIRAVKLTFTARAGDTGKLYGSITTAQIADKLNEKLGTEIDRRKVGGEPLRQLGEHHISVRLSGDHHPEFLVVVQPEGALRRAGRCAGGREPQLLGGRGRRVCRRGSRSLEAAQAADRRLPRGCRKERSTPSWTRSVTYCAKPAKTRACRLKKHRPRRGSMRAT
ncbi:MAG: 50S ribosomal protein L9 [Candidatus Promineofilum sp.]|nr:50S ribosomal protein L9 [Promineifilum sp.]